MKIRTNLLIAVAAAITLSSVAAAGPAVMKQRVQINLRIEPGKTFVLTPLEAGAAPTRVALSAVARPKRN